MTMGWRAKAAMARRLARQVFNPRDARELSELAIEYDGKADADGEPREDVPTAERSSK